MSAKPLIYQFLDVRVEVASFRVSKAGGPIALEPKAIETLIFLLERRGRLVERDELLNGVWRDSFVTPNALTRIIAQLRRELGDDPKEARIIETVPTRGYRFIAEVEQWLEAEPSSPASVESRTSQFIGAVSIVDSQPTLGMALAEEEVPPADITLDRQEEKAWRLTADQLAPEIKPLERNLSRRLWLASAIALALAIPTAIFYQRRAAESQKLSRIQPTQSIAVLPFRQLAPAGGDEYLGVGLADALITRLSGLRQIIVRPTSAVLKFNRPDGDVVAIGRELKVSSVLDGAVQQVGERVRVTVRLISVADGMLKWAESYDAEFKDVFQVQDAISIRIASALSVQLNDVERQRLAKRPTVDIEAYQLYLRGSYQLTRGTIEGRDQAIGYFKQAIARDPSFALAYATLGSVYNFAVSTDWMDRNEAQAKAMAAFQKALSLDPALPDLQAAMGAFQFWGLHNALAARESFTRAMELNPNSVLAYIQYAWFLTATGHFGEAKEALRRAQDIDPLTLGGGADQALPFYYARDYEAVRALAAQKVALDANSWEGHFLLGTAYDGFGDYAKSAAEFERSLALAQKGPVDIRPMLARALALSGKREEANRILKEIASAKALRPPIFYDLALGYLGLGDKETALEWLERARAENDNWLGWVKVDPRLDPIRGDARFVELTKALGVDKWN